MCPAYRPLAGRAIGISGEFSTPVRVLTRGRAGRWWALGLTLQGVDLGRVAREHRFAEIAAERGQVDAPLHRLGSAGAPDRAQDVRLCTEDLVGDWIVDRLLREPHQSQAVKVV